MKAKLRLYLEGTILYRPIYITYKFLFFIFSPVGYINQYLIFPILGFFRKHRIKPFYNKDLQYIDTFQNKYLGTGKRCFIVATGPSLTFEDVKKLYENGEYTIGLNKIYKIYEKTKWRPDVYVALDPYLERNAQNDEDFIPGKFSKEISFLNALYLKLDSYENVHLLHSCWKNHWIKAGEINYNHANNLVYNPDIIYGIFDKYTVTNAAIEIAIFLGFKEIYLLGVDNNYGGKAMHFYETDSNEGMGTKQVNASYCAMTQSYEFMERETKNHGIHVYNATRGGRLEAFDRVDFDTLFDD